MVSSPSYHTRSSEDRHLAHTVSSVHEYILSTAPSLPRLDRCPRRTSWLSRSAHPLRAPNTLTDNELTCDMSSYPGPRMDRRSPVSGIVNNTSLAPFCYSRRVSRINARKLARARPGRRQKSTFFPKSMRREMTNPPLQPSIHVVLKRLEEAIAYYRRWELLVQDLRGSQRAEVEARYRSFVTVLLKPSVLT